MYIPRNDRSLSSTFGAISSLFLYSLGITAAVNLAGGYFTRPPCQMAMLLFCRWTWHSTLKEWEEFNSRKDVANFPLLSLFRFFFPRDGNTCSFNTLHNYWSTVISCHCMSRWAGQGSCWSATQRSKSLGSHQVKMAIWNGRFRKWNACDMHFFTNRATLEQSVHLNEQCPSAAGGNFGRP